MRNVSELNKLASLLKELANDPESSARDRGACFSAYTIVRRIARDAEKMQPVRSPGRLVGAKIYGILQNQEVH